MSRIEYFSWLLLQAGGGLIYLWQVTVVLLGFVLVSAVVTFRHRRMAKRSQVLWLLSPLCLAVAILVLGTVFEHPGSDRTVVLDWPIYLVYALLFAHLPAGVYLASRLKVYRWLTVSVASLSAWVSWWAAFLGVVPLSVES